MKTLEFFLSLRELWLHKKKQGGNFQHVSAVVRKRRINLRNPQNGSDSLLVSYKDTHEVSLVTNISPLSSPNSNVTPEWAAGNRA